MMQSHEDNNAETRVRVPKADLVIRSDHSDTDRFLYNILAELQRANHLHRAKGEVYAMQFTLIQDAPPTHIDFVHRQNNLNVPANIRSPDSALFGLRVTNMGDGTFAAGSAILYYSINMPTLEGGTVVLPISSTPHRYKQPKPAYRSINLRAVGANVTVNIAMEV